MRSTESSGVGVDGFGGAFAQISPLTYVVALTALLAATLFVVTDAVRTFDDLDQRKALISRLGGAQPMLARQFVATAFEPVRRYKVADAETWAPPALSGNRIFVKDVTSLTLWTLN